MINKLLTIVFFLVAAWTFSQGFGQSPAPFPAGPPRAAAIQPPACVVIKPRPDCTVMELAAFDKANLAAAQMQASSGAMVPGPKRSGKLTPGDLYHVNSNGDLVKATAETGVYVDESRDPMHPVVRRK
jgi:hypothetical protein